jgi:hypothetical protein
MNDLLFEVVLFDEIHIGKRRVIRFETRYSQFSISRGAPAAPPPAVTDAQRRRELCG